MTMWRSARSTTSSAALTAPSSRTGRLVGLGPLVPSSTLIPDPIAVPRCADSVADVLFSHMQVRADRIGQEPLPLPFRRRRTAAVPPIPPQCPEYSGKTFTMMGPDISGDPALNGIIPRSSLQVDALQCRPHELPDAPLGSVAFASRVGALVTHTLKCEGCTVSVGCRYSTTSKGTTRAPNSSSSARIWRSTTNRCRLRAFVRGELVCLCASVGTRSSARGSARSMNGSNRLIDCAQIHDLRVKGHDNLQVRRIRTQRNVSRRPVDATVVPRTVGTNGRQACCIARCMLQASHCCVMCCTFGVPCCILHVACRTLLNLAHCLMLHAACFASHFAQVTQSATLHVALSALSVARHLADPRAPDTWHLRGRAVGDADLVARRHRPAHQHRRPPPRHRRHQRMLLIARAVRRANGRSCNGRLG